MLRALCLCSVKATTKLDDSICLQHDLLNTLSLPLRPSAQKKKKIPFKILLLIDNAHKSSKGDSEITVESESESLSIVSDCLWPHGLYSPWNSPGQSTGVSSLCLLQGIFPTQGSPTLQVDSLPSEPPGNPRLQYSVNITFICTGKPKDQCDSLDCDIHLIVVNQVHSISEVCL